MTSQGEEDIQKDFVFDPYDIPSQKSHGRFRFKSKEESGFSGTAQEDERRTKRRRTGGVNGGSEHGNRQGRRHDGAHRHHTHRKRQSNRRREENNKSPPNPTYEMDSEAAFRESLFDAMADDEGAAYWEGVYGQPIHTYPNAKPADPDNPASEFQEMSDEEYVAYVRQQMWEKTHQHVIEERKKREEAAQRRREEKKRTEEKDREKETFDKRIEESLRRGEERKRERAWREAWASYSRKWEKLLARSKADSKSQEKLAEDTNPELLIPWPNRQGNQANVNKDEVAQFFEHAATSKDRPKEEALRAVLKTERIRWHPDKMQQRFGIIKLDAETTKAVVAVFQIVDDMWANANDYWRRR